MQRRGFTLIEVLIASGILVMATGAVLRVGQIAVQSEDHALERIRAYRLVEEGFEIVHQMRDSTRVDRSVNTWDGFFPANDVSVVPVWDPLDERWQLVAPTEDNRAADVIDGVPYERTIIFSEIPADMPPVETLSGDNFSAADLAGQARRVTVRVRWENFDEKFEISADSLLSDWQAL